MLIVVRELKSVELLVDGEGLRGFYLEEVDEILGIMRYGVPDVGSGYVVNIRDFVHLLIEGNIESFEILHNSDFKVFGSVGQRLVGMRDEFLTQVLLNNYIEYFRHEFDSIYLTEYENKKRIDMCSSNIDSEYCKDLRDSADRQFKRVLARVRFLYGVLGISFGEVDIEKLRNDRGLFGYEFVEKIELIEGDLRDLSKDESILKRVNLFKINEFVLNVNREVIEGKY